MKTKDVRGKVCALIVGSFNGSSNPDATAHEIDTLIESFAKQQAIEFAKWCRENYSTHEKWEPIELADGKWRDFDNSNEFTTSQLYELFQNK